jgi:uncharacterized protein (TIGR02145 family)
MPILWQKKIFILLNFMSMKKYLLLVFFFVLTLQSKAQTINDIDGNIYNTVTIGSQVWMKENLKTTKYNNGDAIINITNNTSWISQASGARCYYNNDSTSYAGTYGVLYNWYSVVDTRNVCPTGWHVPSNADWTILTDYLGGLGIAGGKLKEIGTTHWISTNEATNESGFTAIAGGGRYFDGSSYGLGLTGGWWSSTEQSASNAQSISLAHNFTNAMYADYQKQVGLSVRCLKDDILSISDTVLSLNAPINSNGSISITSNTQWTASSNQTWLSVSPTSGSNNSILTLTATAENAGSTARSAIVTLSAVGATSKTITVTQHSGNVSDVSDIESDIYKIYPNPTIHHFYITGIKSKYANLFIYDNVGQLVLSKIINNGKSVDINTLPSGTYYIVILDNNVIVRKKLIK